MHEHISIDVLANWVYMLRADIDGAILLADDSDEARFYERCKNEEAQVVPATELALPLLHKVEKLGVHGVAAASRGVKPPVNSPNVFQPCLGDVASMLLSSTSCERVVQDICGQAWITACEKEVGLPRSTAIWIATALDKLRHISPEGTARALLKPTSIAIDWNTFQPAWERLVPALMADGVPQAALDQIRGRKAGADLRSDLLECDGMDAVEILATATQKYKPRGIPASNAVGTAGLISMLRVAFDLSEFESDEIFWRMRFWERTNRRYRLLREWRTLDPLGVVWDQRYWEADLIAMLKMLKPGEPLAMFKMDLDNFKGVNEALGHSGGDEAIRLYCTLVKDTLGTVGEVYRRGGDEVVSLSPGLGEIPARELAEKARAAIESAFLTWARAHKLDSPPTASVGLALAVAGQSPDTVVRIADEAQRQAKLQGKNRVVVLTEIATDAPDVGNS